MVGEGENAREVMRAVWCVHLSVHFYERGVDSKGVGEGRKG